jgi:hypothetical protein
MANCAAVYTGAKAVSQAIKPSYIFLMNCFSVSGGLRFLFGTIRWRCCRCASEAAVGDRRLILRLGFARATRHSAEAWQKSD